MLLVRASSVESPAEEITKSNLPRYQILQRRCAAAIGYEPKPCARHALEKCGTDVRWAARPIGSGQRLVGVLPQPSDEALEVIRRDGFLDNLEIRLSHQQRNRFEVALQIIRKRIGSPVCNMRAPAAMDEGISVGRGACDPASGNASPCTADVLRDDGLTER